MQKNPYISLLNLMEQVSKSSNSPSIQIGEILQSPPDIKVKYNGIVLTKEDCGFPITFWRAMGGQPKDIWYRLPGTGRAAAGTRLTSRIIMRLTTTIPIR